MTALREILSSITADSPEISPVSLASGFTNRAAVDHAGRDSAMIQALIEAMMLCPEHHRQSQSEDGPLVSGIIF